MSPAFAVDPDQLGATANKLSAALDRDSLSIDAVTNADFGSAEVQAAMETFTSRWSLARSIARGEVETAVETVASTADVYRDGDDGALTLLKGFDW